MIKWDNIIYIAATLLLIGLFCALMGWALSPHPESKKKIESCTYSEPKKEEKSVEPPKEKPEPKSKCIIDYVLNGKNRIDTILSQYISERDKNNCYEFYDQTPGQAGRGIDAIICSEHDVKIVCPD